MTRPAVFRSDGAEHRLIWLSPAFSSENNFVSQFIAAIERRGFRVASFSWRVCARHAPDALIMHWPDEFFEDRGTWKNIKAFAKTLILASLRWRGTRIYWVGHNVKPHDAARPYPALTAFFLRQLDGIFFLSNHSADVVGRTYDLRGISRCIIAHGHYRDVLARPATRSPNASDTVALGFFGQIRRYKGVEDLARAFATVGGGDRLSITGRCTDPRLREELDQAAVGQNIDLDVRPELFSNEALEGAIDAADAIILPYRDVLNSGSVFLALSRNRPVILPNTGSFAEIRERVGANWVHLYDEPLDAAAIRTALDWVRARKDEAAPDLSHYDWDEIGRQIADYLDRRSTIAPRPAA